MSNKKIHPTEVVGWDGSFEELAKVILDMRYDKLAEFFQHFEDRLQTCAVADRVRIRPQLASMQDEALCDVGNLQKKFSEMFDLCKPHMKHEL